MIERLIRKHATAELKGTTLSCRGTEIEQIGDILADILLFFPKKVKYGFVSLGVWYQADNIYKEYKAKLFELPYIKLTGHSLGGGISLLILYFLLRDGYNKPITLHAIGGVKCINKSLANWIINEQYNAIQKNISIIISWDVRYRDPVPWLGFWRMPLYKVNKLGEHKRHCLDYDLDEHLAY